MLAFLFELLIYAVVDTLIQLGVVAAFRGVIEPFLTDRTENLFIAVCRYAAVGLIAGLVSVLVVPNLLLERPAAQYANLIVAPLALGLMFEWLGRWLEAKNKRRMSLDRFSCGFVFALMLGLGRFLFAA